jgi:hypothetical protein
MDAAADVYRRLGFNLTPRGYHTLGSINHLAMFGTDYLELIGVPPRGGMGTDVLAWPAGLNGVVFGTDDAETLHATLSAAGAPVLPPLAFSRPVALPGGARDAAFRTVRVAREAVEAGRLYFCHHLTRDLVWRDAWRRHPNGVLGVSGVAIAAARPGALGGVLRALFGDDALTDIPGGLRLGAGLTRIDIVTRAELLHRFGPAAPRDDGRADMMAALELRVLDLSRTAAALTAGGIQFTDDGARLLVPAEEAFGVTVAFAAG